MARFTSPLLRACVAALLMLGLGAPACSSGDDDDDDDDAECMPGEEGCVSGTGGTTPQCKSGTHGEPSCSDCAADEYCEPGSSSSGIYCLQLCDVDTECCSPLTCMQNEWVYSYQGTICSDDGL